jgi:energy-coupling factor transporter ATP-binding protein EcfA2
MKLRRIEIENFRGFADPVEVEIDDFTAFIGRNDIGKSTILTALNIFLEGDGPKIDPDDGAKRGDASAVRITCEFDELPATVVLDDQFETNLSDEQLLQASGRLRISKIYDCSKKGAPKAVTYLNAENHPLDEKGNSLLPLSITDLKAQAKSLGVELEKGEATVKAKIRRALVERSEGFQAGKVDIPLGKGDLEALWKQVLKHLPMCALFVSDRASSDQDPEAQAPLGLAVKAALKDVDDKLEDLKAHVEKHVQDVAKRTLSKLAEMNKELASELKALPKAEPKWEGLFKYTLCSDEDVPMDKRGSGVRRLLLLNFFRAEAERRASEAGHRPVIYAIEEPETAQHPSHQRMLVRALLEIAENGGQVVVTTHAPGLAGEVPVSGLRFLDEDDQGKKVVRSSESENPHDLFTDLGERLGMLPDNQVRVLVCLEGKNDVRFLKAVSHTLHKDDNSLPDLGSDPRFVLIPMLGGNLKDVVNQHLLKNFRKTEFHLYDQDEEQTYADEAKAVADRDDGSVALQTKKRHMESYFHPEAIKRVLGLEVEVKDEEDFTTELGQKLKVKKPVAKARLANEVAPAMTVFEIDERDGSGEVREWLSTLGKMVTETT